MAPSRVVSEILNVEKSIDSRRTNAVKPKVFTKTSQWNWRLPVSAGRRPYQAAMSTDSFSSFDSIRSTWCSSLSSRYWLTYVSVSHSQVLLSRGCDIVSRVPDQNTPYYYCLLLADGSLPVIQFITCYHEAAWL